MSNILSDADKSLRPSLAANPSILQPSVFSGPREIESTHELYGSQQQPEQIAGGSRHNSRFRFRGDNKQRLRVQIGQRAEAKWRGEGFRWFPVTILKIWDHGQYRTYDILYNDGATEKHVKEEFIRQIST